MKNASSAKQLFDFTSQRQSCFLLFLFFTDVSSKRSQIFAVSYLLAGVGCSFSSCCTRRLSKRFHCQVISQRRITAMDHSCHKIKQETFVSPQWENNWREETSWNCFIISVKWFSNKNAEDDNYVVENICIDLIQKFLWGLSTSDVEENCVWSIHPRSIN